MSLMLIVVVLISACVKEARVTLPEEGSPFLVVSHLKDPALTFVDPHTYEVVQTVPLEEAWQKMIQVNDAYLWALQKQSGVLQQLAKKEGVLTPLTDVGSGFSDVAFSEERNRVYVADPKTGQVHRIDPQTKSLEVSIEVAGVPDELLLSGDDRLFVLDVSACKVSEIDLNKEAVTRTFTVEDRATGLFFDGQWLWIGGHGAIGELNKSVYAYDVRTGEQVAEVEVGLMPIATIASADGHSLYVVSHGDAHLYEIDREAQQVTRTVRVGQNPNYIYRRDGALYVSNVDSDSISIIDEATFTVKKEVPVAGGPHAMLMEEWHE